MVNNMGVSLPVDQVRTWRLPRILGVIAVAFNVFVWVGGGAILATTTIDSGWSGLAGVPVFAVFVGIAYVGARYYFNAVLTAGPDGVTLGRGRHKATLPWQTIDTCEAGYYGMRIRCRDGRSVLAKVPQKPNYAKWLHMTTRADRAARYIEQCAQQARDQVETGRHPGTGPSSSPMQLPDDQPSV
jgi:hypothetical protein